MKRRKKIPKNGVIGRCVKENKVKYKTEKDANVAIVLMFGIINMSLDEYKDLHSYKCDFCGSFHVGHKSFYEIKVRREASNVTQQLYTG